MKKLLKLLTLQSLLVSTHRKRQLILSIILIAVLVVFKIYSFSLLLDVPYGAQIFEVLMYTLGINITINVFRVFLVSAHRHRRGISSEEHDNFTVGLNAIVNAVTALSIIVSIFVAFDIEVRSFLSSIALFAVALTIIFQDFIKNFLFGFAIMFSGDYEIGDYVQVADMPKGVIKNVTFSNLQIKTETGDLLFIPNTVVHTREIVNFSKLKPKRINTEFRLLRNQAKHIDTFEKALFKHLDKMYVGTFELDKCRIFVRESNKDEIIFTLEAPTKKASLKLREQINHTVQKFAVEYQA